MTTTWRDIDWRFEPDASTEAYLRLLVDAVLFAGVPTWTRVRCAAPDAASGSKRALRKICGSSPDADRLAKTLNDPASAITSIRQLVTTLQLLDPNDRRFVARDDWFGWAHGEGWLVKAFDPNDTWPCARAEMANVILAAVINTARERAGTKVNAPASNPGPRREPPTFHDSASAARCEPHDTGSSGWVVDIAKAYGQLAFPMGWDLEYRREGAVVIGAVPWWGCEVWARDKRLAQRVLGLTEAEGKAFSAPDLWDWRIDCLHAVAGEAVRDWRCVYWATDGGVFPDRATADEFAEHLTTTWGLDVRVKPNQWDERNAQLLGRDHHSDIADDVDVDLLLVGRHYALDLPGDAADQLPPLAMRDDPDLPANPKTGEVFAPRTIHLLDLLDADNRHEASHTLESWRTSGNPGDRLHGDRTLAQEPPTPRSGIARARGYVAKITPRRWADNDDDGYAVELAAGAVIDGRSTDLATTLRHLDHRPDLAVGDALDALVAVADQPRPPGGRRRPGRVRYLDTTPNPDRPAPDPQATNAQELPMLEDRWTTTGTECTYTGTAQFDETSSQRWMAADQGTVDGEPVPPAAYLDWWGENSDTAKGGLPIRITVPELAEAVRVFLAPNGSPGPLRPTQIVYREHRGSRGSRAIKIRVLVGFEDEGWWAALDQVLRAADEPQPADEPSTPTAAGDLEERVRRLEADNQALREALVHLTEYVAAHIAEPDHNRKLLGLTRELSAHREAAVDLLGLDPK